MTEHATPRRMMPQGTIEVMPQAIATLAVHAATQTTGVLGMARTAVNDEHPALLGRHTATKGVEVQTLNGEVLVDVYVVLAYGGKLATIAQQVQANVEGALRQALGGVALRVGVRVQGLDVPHEEPLTGARKEPNNGND